MANSMWNLAIMTIMSNYEYLPDWAIIPEDVFKKSEFLNTFFGTCRENQNIVTQ